MYKKRAVLMEAMAKIPGLQGLDIPVEDLPLDDEFERLSATLDAELAALPLDINAMCECTAQARSERVPAFVPSATSSKKLKPITIRIPGRVLDAYRARAVDKGIGYQTLIVQTLKDAARDW